MQCIFKAETHFPFYFSDVSAPGSNPALPAETSQHSGAGGGEEAAAQRDGLLEVTNNVPLLFLVLITATKRSSQRL